MGAPGEGRVRGKGLLTLIHKLKTGGNNRRFGFVQVVMAGLYPCRFQVPFVSARFFSLFAVSSIHADTASGVLFPFGYMRGRNIIWSSTLGAHALSLCFSSKRFCHNCGIYTGCRRDRCSSVTAGHDMPRFGMSQNSIPGVFRVHVWGTAVRIACKRPLSRLCFSYCPSIIR